ncbi:hypothetical protein CY34DRAFT_564344 [Suillus luteus UH-Slu-Lm8-n1]|uniref:Uncharacterized protein n=1 Tax=Suillus luteus UH-Slu-Lm8-n1 TaxID=930992 RepID=A0A0D0A4T9_9AGAM|nr:hypothetical protein CY34DRAFT_564344 [Suillus luteus UH-Slu-Lm8-n1]
MLLAHMFGGSDWHLSRRTNLHAHGFKLCMPSAHNALEGNFNVSWVSTNVNSPRSPAYMQRQALATDKHSKGC